MCKTSECSQIASEGDAIITDAQAKSDQDLLIGKDLAGYHIAARKNLVKAQVALLQTPGP